MCCRSGGCEFIPDWEQFLTKFILFCVTLDLSDNLTGMCQAGYCEFQCNPINAKNVMQKSSFSRYAFLSDLTDPELDFYSLQLCVSII